MKADGGITRPALGSLLPILWDKSGSWSDRLTGGAAFAERSSQKG